MELKLTILNSEHFIVSSDGELIRGALFAYLPCRDAIVINNKCRHLEKLVELMVVYLELPGQLKEETKEYAAKNAAIQEYLRVLDRITRIRRKLYKSLRRR